MRRVAIIGSRDTKKWALPIAKMIVGQVYTLATEPDGCVLVSGGAAGVDSLAEQAGKFFGMKMIIIVPNWDKHGKRAAFLRNQRVAETCDHMIAWWDGKSRGTVDAVRRAKRAGKTVSVMMVNESQDNWHIATTDEVDDMIKEEGDA